MVTLAAMLAPVVRRAVSSNVVTLEAVMAQALVRNELLTLGV